MEKSGRLKDRETTTSLDTYQNSCLPQQITMDLTMDIFSRLPLKSIAICRCVSKQWASLLAHPDFTNLRLTRSQARPRLLFACFGDNKVVFLSSPHPQSPDDDEMFVAAADHHMSFSFDHPVKEVSISVSGFVCVGIRGYQLAANGSKLTVEESVICNPSTGRSLTLPRMKKARNKTGMVRFLGYDPVEKLHKVLGMICSPDDRTKGHQVLTLGGGSENTEWRMADECGIPCASYWDRHSLCIDGVFYYIEFVKDGSSSKVRMVICFDVRSDKFGFVKFPVRNYPVWSAYPRLLDCNGKLGLVASRSLDATSERIVMWVLQDPERHEWSELVFIFPPVWKDLVNPEEQLEIVGLTGPDEFVMASAFSSDPFHVYYCNFGKGTVTRAVIQGMGAAFGSGRTYHVRTSLNHVEDVKLMEL